MTPQSVVLALIVGSAASVLFSRLGRKPLLQIPSILGAMAVELFVLVAIESYAAGNPPFSNPGWLTVPPWLVFSSAVAGMLALASPNSIARLRLWFFGVEDATEMPVTREEKQAFAVLLAVGATALVGGIVFLRFETQRQSRNAIEAVKNLSALKRTQIEHWRDERFADIDTLTRMPSLADLLHLEFSKASDPRLDELGDWARAFVKDYGYASLVLFDPTMKPVFSYPKKPDLELPALREQLKVPLDGTTVVELKPYLDGSGTLRWDLLVPLHRYKQTQTEGLVLLQTDPARFLNPILESWPPEYTTGQSTLWLREGDQVVSLAGGRLTPGYTPEEIRPFGSVRRLSGIPPGSVSALIFGAEVAAAEGLDRRGQPIVGVGGPIRDSNWAFSSRLDATDVYTKVRLDALGIAGLIAGLFVGTGFITGRLSRQRQHGLREERMAAELEQKRTAARLGAVMSQANDIILVIDENMRLVDANQRALETYGWTREGMLRKMMSDLPAPGVPGDARDRFVQANTADGLIFESVHQRQDGRTFPVEVSSRRVELDGATQMLAIVRDITERRSQQVRIAQLSHMYQVLGEINEVIFRSAFKADLLANVCRTLVDKGGFKIAWVRWYDPVTHTLEPFVEHGGSGGDARVTTQSDDPEGRGPSSTAFRENRTYVCNDFFADPGTVPWRRIAATKGIQSCLAMPIRQSGEPMGVLAVYSGEVDFFGGEETALLEKAAANVSFALDKLEETERRQVSEEARRASEERYRLIAENTSDVIWLYDLGADAFNYVSPAVHALRGFEPAEIVGQKLMHGVAPGSRSALERLLADMIASGGSRRHAVVETDLARKDGSTVPVEIMVTMLTDAAGRATRVMGITRDLTERIRAREGEVAKVGLEREKKLSGMKSQFISVASHEFRSPLATAVGSLELLERHAAKLTEMKRAELLARIKQALGRLTAIMNDVLSLSRADSGRVQAKRMAMDLGRFVEDVVREVELGDHQQHSFVYEKSGGPEIVPVDSKLLHHVLSNLLGNAVRYAPAGTRISVRLELGEVSVSLTVADEGIGIPEQDRDTIFEPFVRGSNVGNISGTGLGLNIVKRYTELMGGTITLLPTQRGAAFQVVLPVQPKES